MVATTKGAPIVVKADGLALGKGVVVAPTIAAAVVSVSPPQRITVAPLGVSGSFAPSADSRPCELPVEVALPFVLHGLYLAVVLPQAEGRLEVLGRLAQISLVPGVVMPAVAACLIERLVALAGATELAVLDRGADDAHVVDALVLVEALVLDRDRGVLDDLRDRVARDQGGLVVSTAADVDLHRVDARLAPAVEAGGVADAPRAGAAVAERHGQRILSVTRRNPHRNAKAPPLLRNDRGYLLNAQAPRKYALLVVVHGRAPRLRRWG